MGDLGGLPFYMTRIDNVMKKDRQWVIKKKNEENCVSHINILKVLLG
jgi:hypothetical protein